MYISATDRLDKKEIIDLLDNSSGIILEEIDDAITIGYVDYDVPEFGGHDYECFYKLDSKNSKLLKKALSDIYTGDLFEMCVQAFSIKFSDRSFESFCADNNITYTRDSYGF